MDFEALIVFILLTVLHSAATSPPKIANFNFGTDITAGSRVTTTCSIVSGTPPFEIQWLKNGRPVQSSGSVLFDSGRESSVVVFKPVSVEDVANYTCLVKNSYGSDSFTARLIVKSPPAWIVKPVDLETSQGLNTTVKCLVSGEPKPRITWKRLKGASWELIKSNEEELVLPSVKVADRGSYSCEADNGLEKPLYAEFSINVKVPAHFEEKFSRVTVKKGGTVKMDCYANGDQPMTISWAKDSANLKSRSDRHEIMETLTNEGIKSELVLRNAERADGGLYVCITQNTYGKDEKSNKLLVIEEPAAPSNLLVREVWSRAASIFWTSPYTGNSPITGYIVQYWRESESGENKRLREEPVTASQTSFMLKNLQPGSSYEMNVIALNEVGRGQPSNLVKFKTGEEEPAGTPLDVIAEPKGPRTIRVSWKAPHREKWNGELRGFYIGYKLVTDYGKPYSLRSIPAGNPNFTYEYLLQGLSKASEYSLVIKAHNAAGIGPESQELIAKTLPGDLPPSPKIYLIAITTDSAAVMWKMIDSSFISSKITGYSVHMKAEYQSSWKEIGMPYGLARDEGDYILKGLDPNTVYYVYVTAINNYGHGDPSELLQFKTRDPSDSSIFGAGSGSIFAPNSPETMNLMAFQQNLLPFISIIVAVVIVIIVLIISYVCIKKAQLDASKPPIALVAPRGLIDDKGDIYVGTTHRYVDFDQRPLMQGNITHLVDAQGNMCMYPVAQFATLAPGTSAQQQQNEEMKSFMPQSTPNWQRPLPAKPDQRKSMLAANNSDNVYDYPSGQ